MAGQNSKISNRFLWHAGAAGVLLLLNYVLLKVFAGDGAASSTASNLYLDVIDVIVLFSLFQIYRKTARQNPPEARAWLFLMLGRASYMAGDFLWTYTENILLGNPFPSISDPFYILFYGLTAVGLLLYPAAPAKAGRWKLSLEMAAVMIGSILVFWAFLFGPNLQAEVSDPLTLAASLAYPAGDLGLLWALFALFARARQPHQKNILAIIGGSVFCFLLTDSIFGYQTIQGTYQTGGLLDLGWMASVLLMGLAAVYRGLKLDHEAQPEAPVPESQAPNPWTIFAPYASLAVVFGLLIWNHLGPLPIDFIALALGVGAINALILARQIIVLRENNLLYQEARQENARRRQAEQELLQNRAQLEERVAERTQALAAANRALEAEICERKQAQQVLSSTQARLQLLLANTPGIIYSGLAASNFQTTYISENVVQQLGYQPEEFLQDPNFWLNQLHPEDRPAVERYLGDLSERQNYSTVYRIRAKDGRWRWVQDSLKVIHDSQGQPQEMIGLMVDISERKCMEQQLRDSLAEKETLLKEIHHRVKNNLQVISSLLNLQAETLADPRLRQYFTESQNRIASMSLVHEKLYRSENLAQINFGDYLRSLSAAVAYSYGEKASRVQLDLQVMDMKLDINRAVSCGLIINELLSNSYKYAFPLQFKPGEPPTITMVLRSDDPATCTLLIGDNGVGLPPGLDLNRIESLGLQLVNMLVAQIDGTLQIDSARGACFTIRFPLEPASS